MAVQALKQLVFSIYNENKQVKQTLESRDIAETNWNESLWTKQKQKHTRNREESSEADKKTEKESEDVPKMVEKKRTKGETGIWAVLAFRNDIFRILLDLTCVFIAMCNLFPRLSNWQALHYFKRLASRYLGKNGGIWMWSQQIFIQVIFYTQTPKIYFLKITIKTRSGFRIRSKSDMVGPQHERPSLESG